MATATFNAKDPESKNCKPYKQLVYRRLLSAAPRARYKSSPLVLATDTRIMKVNDARGVKSGFSTLIMAKTPRSKSFLHENG